MKLDDFYSFSLRAKVKTSETVFLYLYFVVGRKYKILRGNQRIFLFIPLVTCHKEIWNVTDTYK